MLSVVNKPTVLYGVMLNVVLPSAIMLNVIMLNVVMLNVVMLNVVMLNVIMLIVILLNVVMLNVIMFNVILLNVVMLIVVMLNVMAPETKFSPTFTFSCFANFEIEKGVFFKIYLFIIPKFLRDLLPHLSYKEVLSLNCFVYQGNVTKLFLVKIS
jgi:hypothetical protein